MPKNLTDMNHESLQLVEAARASFATVEVRLDAPVDVDLAAAATAAVLRKLADLQRPGWEDGSEWPDPDDLELIANDITGGGK